MDKDLFTPAADDIENIPARALPGHQSGIIRGSAHLLSFLFHPLFIPAYVTAFLIFVHPFVFAAVNEKVRILRLISVVLLTAFFPAFTVFLLKRLGFISSIFLRTQKERIIPYIASMTYFFWIFHVSRNLPDSPPVFVLLTLGIFLSSIGALMANIYFKISMHAIAMGGMFCFFVMLSMQGEFTMGVYLCVAMLIAGMVCSSRLIISDHHPFEVYSGFFVGILCQAVAAFFV